MANDWITIPSDKTCCETPYAKTKKLYVTVFMTIASMMVSLKFDLALPFCATMTLLIAVLKDQWSWYMLILLSDAAGNSIFFTVRRIEDPIGLLPAKAILGINKRGVHFFRPVPKEYIHSAELRDIMQFGSSSAAVFFKMRVAGVLHIFQFETRQGEDICMALQTHINDIMMKRYSKVSHPAAAGACPCWLLAACRSCCTVYHNSKKIQATQPASLVTMCRVLLCAFWWLHAVLIALLVAPLFS